MRAARDFRDPRSPSIRPATCHPWIGGAGPSRRSRFKKVLKFSSSGHKAFRMRERVLRQFAHAHACLNESAHDSTAVQMEFTLGI